MAPNSNECLPMIKELVGLSHKPLLQTESNSALEMKSDRNDLVTIETEDYLDSAISGCNVLLQSTISNESSTDNTDGTAKIWRNL